MVMIFTLLLVPLLWPINFDTLREIFWSLSLPPNFWEGGYFWCIYIYLYISHPTTLYLWIPFSTPDFHMNDEYGDYAINYYTTMNYEESMVQEISYEA